MKIAIIGNGFVGKALNNGLNDDVHVKLIDPLLNSSVEDLRKYDAKFIFVCVPTPMNDNGSQDISIVLSVINDLKKINYDGFIVLKSTVLPKYASEVNKIYKKFIYNPEFLREKHANEDFINSDLIVFGGKREHCKKLSNFYSKYTRCISKEHLFMNIVSACIVKYAINSFLATKVIFFNELKGIFNKIDDNKDNNWQKILNAISSDSRIGPSHINVPGHDGRFGFGGACLPKDTTALLKYSEGLGEEFKLLKTVISVNNNLRAKYNELTDREIQQNINYIDNSEE